MATGLAPWRPVKPGIGHWYTGKTGFRYIGLYCAWRDNYILYTPGIVELFSDSIEHLFALDTTV